ncbi:uncharacterized protein [Chironomus tepperi]|uniref:uncharacterized protein n=1 Tax=Chironomus tepperi TaxID=113505 RepID=UPI00391FBD32
MAKYIVLFVTMIVLAHLSESKPAYQVLKPRAGFIPVFIRYGNQPLSEIDPLLAEAFGEHENEITARNIKSDTAINAPLPAIGKSIDEKNSEGIIKDSPNSIGFTTR